jgi:phenylalanyl-tRNA synthetase beta chain
MAQISATVEMAIRQPEAKNWVQMWRLFDVHRGGIAAGEKSLAMRFWLQDTEGTLNDEAVERVMQHLLRALETAGARLRG